MNVWKSEEEDPAVTAIHALNQHVALFLVRSVQAFDLEALARSLR